MESFDLKMNAADKLVFDNDKSAQIFYYVLVRKFPAILLKYTTMGTGGAQYLNFEGKI